MSQDFAERPTAFVADETAEARPKPQRLRLLAILSALMGFASISTDLYLPAMPTMAKELDANAGSMELTVSGFLIGFSLGQLLWGPLGDRFGRRLPVAAGLLLFVLGSAGCALSGSPEQMICWRIVQAVGACSGVVLSRAMVRDLYEGSRAAQMLSTLIIVMAIAPLLGPIVGGQVLAIAGWRAIFWLLVIVGLVTLAALFTIPETLPVERRSKDSILDALRGHLRLVSNRRLLSFAAAGGFFYAGVYAYIAGTPFAFIEYYHVAPQLYGVLFALGIVGIMLANIFNARLVTSFGSRRLLQVGSAGAAVSGLVLLVTGSTGWGGLAGLAIPLFVFVSWSGLIVANSIGGALQDFPAQAGAVSALVGALHYGSGIVGSAAVSRLADGTPFPLALVVAVAGVGSLLSLVLLPPNA
ncbi:MULTISPECIES: multidrug effflux MFS transporter [Rhizobium]|uniref:Bcr/CflA family efflux transporter n=1 Tax=Rhizobium favelukesii TaxID=348824 RepID=W6RHZ2_9HYPH|nr:MULTISPECIES: multidrug effflux MFS transporter [Rhizobium]MCA0807018.1 multidrug effflux MFS transporter [Rhizobium sp. T1473]MCS0461533.1 multidrug effflux MFS transporter [Rhizobium favelukesii]UFS85538.1 multidrug effflux MFS transporter [Rhizobium sp. T136]CDM60832.1 Bicyclomycin resistance protein Sulfonamide resistance protein [Rhizobium favelukesii]